MVGLYERNSGHLRVEMNRSLRGPLRVATYSNSLSAEIRCCSQ